MALVDLGRVLQALSQSLCLLMCCTWVIYSNTLQEKRSGEGKRWCYPSLHGWRLLLLFCCSRVWFFCDPMKCSLPGSSVHLLHCRQILSHWATWEALWMKIMVSKKKKKRLFQKGDKKQQERQKACTLAQMRECPVDFGKIRLWSSSPKSELIPVFFFFNVCSLVPRYIISHPGRFWKFSQRTLEGMHLLMKHLGNLPNVSGPKC